MLDLWQKYPYAVRKDPLTLKLMKKKDGCLGRWIEKVLGGVHCSGTSEVIGSCGSNEAAAVLVTTCKIVLSHGLLKDLGGRGSIPRQGTSVRGYVSGYW